MLVKQELLTSSLPAHDLPTGDMPTQGRSLVVRDCSMRDFLRMTSKMSNQTLRNRRGRGESQPEIGAAAVVLNTG